MALLALAWLLYVFLHSLLATRFCKRLVEKLSPRALIYYRLFYNIFATITIVLVIHFQFSIEAPGIYQATATLKVFGYGFAILGLLIIIGAFVTYPFIEFAGLDIFLKREKTENKLIARGLSKQVRHPLYLGLFLIAWGIFTALPKPPHLIMAITFTLYIYIGLRIEERRLLQEFGDAYRQYRKNTPFLFPLKLFKINGRK